MREQTIIPGGYKKDKANLLFVLNTLEQASDRGLRKNDYPVKYVILFIKGRLF